MSLTKNQIYRFGEFELKAHSRSLVRDGKEIVLGSKAFEVLIYLLQHAGAVVSKEELLQTVWPESFVEESNLSQHIYGLRKAFADRAGYILTIPGRGYQFTASVQTISQAEGSLQSQTAPTQLGGVLVQTVRERTHVVIHESAPAAMAPAPLLQLPPPDPMRSSRVVTIAVAGSLAIASICLFAYWFLARRGAAPPIRVSNYIQITHDGHDKYLSGTDGSRLYFTQRSPQLGEQISTSGGAPAPVPNPIPNSWIGEVSPDGSTVFIQAEAGGMTSASTIWSSAILGGSLRRLAPAVTSTWSPDGDLVAYATQDGDLYSMHSDGTHAVKLASIGGYVESLAWSPNGKLLRYSKGGNLWQISAHGSDLQQLLTGWRIGSPKTDVRFGSDGRFFFVCEGEIWTLEERRRLFGDTFLEPVALTSGPIRWTDPIPSKDGKKLFAVGATRRGELVRYDAPSGKFQPLLGGISAEFVDYSKDGKSLLYVTFPDGVLWKANRDGSTPIQLTSPPAYPKLPRWSPDGKQIVFVGQSPEGPSAIYTIPSEGGAAPARLLPNDPQPETDPGWSPDGSSVVFSTSPEELTNPKPVLQILKITTGQVTLVPGSEGLFSPRWSPDGKLIAASTVDSLAMKVFNLASRQWSTLNTGPVAFPNWSSDSRSLEYLCWLDDPVILRIGIDGGKPAVVAHLKGEQYIGVYTSWLGLDPSDTPLTLLDRGTKDIYALTLSEK